MSGLKMKSVVVTGATSMIGISLIKTLLKDLEIENIYAVIRPKSKKADLLPVNNRIKLIECDVRNYENLAEYINANCDVFFHLAWPRTQTYEETLEDMLEKSANIQAVLMAVNTAIKLGCHNFVGAGSQSEYGNLDVEKFTPETPCKPVRADGIVHWAAGQLAMNLACNAGINCNWMRIFSIYGKFDRMNSMIMTTILKLMKKEQCPFTPAEQMWDFLHADDAGRAFYLVGKKVVGSHIYCLGSGKAKKLKDYIHIIRDVVDPEAELGIGELPYPDNPIMKLCADVSSLQRETGWMPNVSFYEGITQIYGYLKGVKG